MPVDNWSKLTSILYFIMEYKGFSNRVISVTVKPLGENNYKLECDIQFMENKFAIDITRALKEIDITKWEFTDNILHIQLINK